MSDVEHLLHMENIEFTIIKKNIKNVYFKVGYPHGHVIISAPFFISDKVFFDIVREKIPWIKAQRQKISLTFSEEHKTYVLSPFEDGAELYFFGEKYVLKIFTNYNVQKVEKITETRTICVFVNNKMEINKYFNEWLLTQMNLQLLPLIEKYEKSMGVKVNKIRIKKMKTRWGSCTPSLKRISLNFQLIKLPISCLEYILVHEMVHFFERKHNNNFYSLMNLFMPNWLEYEKIIKQAETGHFFLF